MSNWPGNLIRKTPVTPAGPLQNGAAPGIWSLAEAAYWTKQGLWPTAGNFLAVEDVFSTYLYTGNNGAQSINNGLNLSGQGGLVWLKNRGSSLNNILIDTAQGSTFAGGKNLISNSTSAAGTIAANTFQFDSTGFSFGSAASGGAINASGNNYVSWSFREAPKFFDVLTYTGNGASNRAISHSLASSVGMIIIKATGATDSWWVWHRSFSTNEYIFLNQTAAKASGADTFPTTPTTTDFYVGANGANVNAQPYVAYLFAHDTASTGIIQCGSFDIDGTGNATVNLGWEPQWVLAKTTEIADTWAVFDNMRGMPVSGTVARLCPNTTAADTYDTDYIARPTSTGFQFTATGFTNPLYNNFIYIAIRRGPMRTPTLGTTVFSPVSQTPSGVTTITTGFPVDMTWFANRSKASFSFTGDVDRLRGTTQTSTNILSTNTTDAEGAVGTYGFGYDRMTSITDNYSNSNWGATTPVIYWNFRRAPSFFDEVCYTGTGVANRQVAHNLGVVPELIIVKSRSAAVNWEVLASNIPRRLNLNTTSAGSTPPPAIVFGDDTNYVAPTSSYFVVGTNGTVNSSANTYVAYLFASCPGVSKVGSYTGTGTTQTINCGFTTGARFVLIKRTDSTGDWYVWDSARGIVAGNDPYLLLNSTAAEVTSTDYIDTDNSGFQIDSTAPAGINANGGSYIFLAIS